MTIVKIGNPRGRIAVYLDEMEAIDMAHHYGPGDAAYDELMRAVEQAYPETAPEPHDPHGSEGRCREHPGQLTSDPSQSS